MERTVEAYLVKKVKDAGGFCIKLVGIAGIPDRLVLLPKGRIVFVELKDKGKKPRPLQQHRLDKLRGLGFEALSIDDVEKVRVLFDEV